MPKVEKKCPNCGHHLSVDQAFCPNCDLFVPMDVLEDELNKKKNTPTENKLSEEPIEIEEEITDDFFKHRHTTTDTFKMQTEKKHKQKEPNVATDSSDASPEIVEEAIASPADFIDHDKTVEPNEEEIIFVEEETKQFDPAPLLDTEMIDQEKADPISDEVNNHRAENETIENDTKEIKGPSIQEEPTMTPKKASNGFKKWIGIAAALVIIGGGGYWYHSYQTNQDEIKQQKVVASSETAIKALYLNSEHIFLKENISSKDLDKAEQAGKNLKNTKNFAEYTTLLKAGQTKFKKQEALNQLFKTPVMNGDTIDENAELTTEETINLVPIENPADAFDKNYNTALEYALKQESALTELKTAMAKIYSHDDVVTSVTKEQYDEAKELVDALPTSDNKTNLVKELEKVKSFLDKQEKENQAIAKNETTATLDNNQQTQATTTQPVAPSTRSSNQRWGNREDSTKDFSDAAWAWNPGIQDKFLKEVIQRGYVVEGGYYLTPKYVENGEGYYDLYATTNSRLFPKSKPEEFPIYLVTVNVKTGWYAGNGPN
ncbi:cell division site-positioning protein MapZ family protein [Vagococcus sp.]|uniref:cell division site-positioning protein MapZ family protein n=1 Tax=Vagococcus sp. TaxID=1933889 RepID=UPI003F9CDD7C